MHKFQHKTEPLLSILSSALPFVSDFAFLLLLLLLLLLLSLKVCGMLSTQEWKKV